MRILFVSHYALPHLGGIEVALDGLAGELRGRGHDVVHLASDALRPGEEVPPGGGGGVRVRAWNGLERRWDVPYPLFSPGLVGAVRDEVARADVVHAHGFLYLSSLAGLLCARRGARPTGPARILTEHVGHVGYPRRALDLAQRAAVASLGRACVRAAEAVVVLNDKVRAEVEALRPARPPVLIPNGVDTGAYRPPEPGEREELRRRLGWDDRPHVLFAGRLVPKKGVDIALAAAALAGGEFELVVVGPGRLGAPAARVTALGPLPREELARMYRAADAFLLPSMGEGFPVTAQEAMASGLPVVLSDEPAYRRYVEGAEAVVRLVPPWPTNVVRALRELLEDRPAPAAEAVAHARAHFSLERAADEHERLYARVLASR